MVDNDAATLNRRGFIQHTGVVAGASALAVGALGRNASADEPAAEKTAIPTRKLGKTGVDVSIINHGTWRNPSLDKLVRMSYASGVRYYDTAKSYGSEPGLAKWFESAPEVRKSIFLVTKDSPHTPDQLPAMLDQRLKALKVDHVDLIFVHALGDHHTLDEAIEFAGGDGFKKVAEAIRKSGKAKFVGFSTHHKNRDQIIAAAAKAGFVDAIMVQNNPWIDKDSALNKSIDAAHKAGIGLISMKQVAGANDEKMLAEMPKKAPALIAKGLTPYGAMLNAIWTDERFATCCISMRNTDQIRDNVKTAKMYEPMTKVELQQLRDVYLASQPTLCANCDGRCAEAGGTKASLGDLTRFLTYFEHHGLRGEARKNYQGMTAEARDWRGADLAAAQKACPANLDFSELLQRADRCLA